MAKIQLTPAELLSQSAEMSALQSQYEGMFQSVNGILQDVNRSWSANLANNFAGKIATAQSSFTKVSEMLQTGAQAAANSANTYASMDSQLAGLTNDGGVDLRKMSAGSGGGGATRDIDGFMQMAAAAGVGKEAGRFMEYAKKEVGDSWNNAGDLFTIFEKWRKETASGEASEKLYDTIGKIMKEASKNSGHEIDMGQWKKAFDITSDIIRGDVGIDTVEKGVEAITKDSIYSKALTSVVGLVTDEKGYYQTRMREYEDKMAARLKEGDVLGTVYLMGASYVDVSGTGVIETGATLVKGALHLDTVNSIVKNYSGIDILKEIDKNAADTRNKLVEYSDGFAEALGRTSKNIGSVISDIGDGFGKLFRKGK